jgi:hypothetical protein
MYVSMIGEIVSREASRYRSVQAPGRAQDCLALFIALLAEAVQSPRPDCDASYPAMEATYVGSL